MRLGARLAVVGPVCAALVYGAVASAQAPGSEADRARAEQAFKEALADEQAGRYEKAVAELVEARTLARKDTPQLLFHLGVCHAHLGKMVLARDELRVAADRAQAAGLDTVASTARVQLEETEGKVGVLTPARPAHGTVSSLSLDGADVTAKLGMAIEVDPGTHALQATFADHGTSSVSVTVGAGERKGVTLPDSAGAPPPTATAAPAPSTAPGTTPVPPPPPLPASDMPASVRSSGGSKTLGWIGVGAGAAIVGGGVAMWVLRGNAISTLNGECGASHQACPQSASGTISNGKLYDDLGVAMFIIGGAALIGGAGLLVFGGGSGSSSAAIAPVVTAHGGGVGIQGRLW